MKIYKKGKGKMWTREKDGTWVDGYNFLPGWEIMIFNSVYAKGIRKLSEGKFGWEGFYKKNEG